MSSEPVIECRGLACGYDFEPVIEGVDLTVQRAEVLVVVGPSGAGKTTLLKTILGMMAPLAGEVRLLGEDPLHPGNRRGRVGVLFQKDALLSSETVLENVALPLRELTSLPDELVLDIALHKLAMVNLRGLEYRMPGEISGGQSRRVALARACVTDPEVILCDEPTSGLDPIAGSAVHEILRSLCDNLGVTVLAITHELWGARTIADRVAMIDRGGVRSVGSFHELEQSRDPGVREFFDRASRGVAA